LTHYKYLDVTVVLNKSPVTRLQSIVCRTSSGPLLYWGSSSTFLFPIVSAQQKTCSVSATKTK